MRVSRAPCETLRLFSPLLSSPSRPSLASLPISISIGTNSDHELGADSVGFLHRNEKSLNRRSYRCAAAHRRNASPPKSLRPSWIRAAPRDKDLISTSRSRKVLLAPARISLSGIFDKTPRGLLGSSAPNQLCELAFKVFYSFCIFFISLDSLFHLYIHYLYLYFM